MGGWQILLVEDVAEWFNDLTKNDPGTADLIEDAIDRLAAEGPTLGRPLVDRVKKLSAPQHEGVAARINGIE
ncbi:hypothetical protein ACIBF5_15555 [Micromonospora sp. NPDC050417]|uniref:hypothetical protein n=1 Tax=Micromonospora sp. NPDC050417 TaxID=3364280 RepID=UPI00379A6983